MSQGFTRQCERIISFQLKTIIHNWESYQSIEWRNSGWRKFCQRSHCQDGQGVWLASLFAHDKLRKCQEKTGRDFGKFFWNQAQGSKRSSQSQGAPSQQYHSCVGGRVRNYNWTEFPTLRLHSPSREWESKIGSDGQQLRQFCQGFSQETIGQNWRYQRYPRSMETLWGK